MSKSTFFKKKRTMNSSAGKLIMKIHFNEFLCVARNMQKSAFHMILLNSESLSIHQTKQLWDICGLKICADGGANRLFDGLQEPARQAYVPNFITGDLDSLRDHVSEYYSALGTQVVEEPDQDSNDLDKSLMLLRNELQRNNKVPSDDTVLVLGGFGGRFDQEIASMNSLYRWNGAFHRLLLVDSKSTTELLEPGVKHIIRPVRIDGIHEGKYCGLLPLANKVDNLLTTGLEWNLYNEPLEFGKRISTSNRIPAESEEVTVITSHNILWTCTFDKKE